MNYFKKWWVWYWIIGVPLSFLIGNISTSNSDFPSAKTFASFLVIILFLVPLFSIAGLVLSIKEAKSKKIMWAWLILMLASLSLTLFVFIAGPR
jgi:hypothetical protein